MGIRGKVSRNTLAHANETRDWRIYADFAHVLIKTARQLYADEDFGLELDQTAYAFDSTTIDLCLSVYPWAKFRKSKAAVKLHTLLDLRGNIPAGISITNAKIHDVNVLDDLLFEAGAVYIFDRGYVDFARLYRIHLAGAFYIIRAKSNFVFKRLYSRPVDKSTGVRADQIITVAGFYTLKDYPEQLRRIRYFDSETKKRFVFMTNNLTLPAVVIAQLHKCRWQVELFFKWIKQHLRIKAFYGTTENAVKTQIWIAISIYVLIAIVKNQLKIDRSLYTILQILSVSLFEKTPIFHVLSSTDYEDETFDDDNQLNFQL
jgi:IS4 transposase